ncbi:MAG: flavin reductase family protein [Actinobacteria bacterium]|nr:flavin reductase family protein [Actinomycetota bacterium]
MDQMTAMNTQAFKDAMALLAAPVTVVTAEDTDGYPCGFTASSVSSVSLNPPLIAVGLSKTSSCHAAMLAAEEFVVNILGAAHRELASQFAISGIDRFAGVRTIPWDGHGTPPRLSDVHVLLRCRRSDVVEAGDHHLVLGAVTDVRTGDGNEHGRLPAGLVWFQRAFHAPALCTCEETSP